MSAVPLGPPLVPVQSLPASVVIREVGPRDGLQGERAVSPASRATLVQALLDAGVKNIEAVSFVSPKAVPAMADPEEVLRSISRTSDVVLAALVPNLVGAERALEAGVNQLTATVAASPEYNRRNVKMSIEDSVKQIEQICEVASSTRVPVDAVISCAFGSPYEGEVAPDQVVGLAQTLLSAGVSAITLADTTGMATPRVLSAVLDAMHALPGVDLGLHMHETRGTGLLNCYVAMGEGVSRFDTSIGGLGGSPFADGAAGNISTEDLVALLDDLGVRSGIEIERLLQASAIAEELVGHKLQSRVAYAGPRLADCSPRSKARTPEEHDATEAPPEAERDRGDTDGNEGHPTDAAGASADGRIRSKRRKLLMVGGVVLAVLAGGGIFAAIATSGGSDSPALVDRTDAPAPQLSLPNLLSPTQEISLSAFRGRGLVLNFWASWCYPCTKEMPLLEAAYRSEHGRVQFLGVDSGDSSGAAVSFLTKVHVTYPSVFDPQENEVSAYGLFGLPTTVFISADGKVLGRHIGQLDSKTLHEALEEAFGVK